MSGKNHAGKARTEARAPVETSPLVDGGEGGGGDLQEVCSVGSDVTAGSAAGGEPPAEIRLWEELEKPWPSTYERSIALLASPGIRRSQVALYTKSPKPGSTPAALARRRDLRKGFYTPDIAKVVRPINLSGRSTTITSEEEALESIRGQFQKMDLKAQKQQLLDTQRTQQMKAAEAKKYREKILKQAKGAPDDDGLKSPGYFKEVAIRTTRSKKVEDAEALMQDGKSSVAQCVFNLANILMGVGLLGLPFALKSAGWIGGLGCLLAFGFICWRTAILIGRELNGDPRPSHAFVDSPFKTPLLPRSVPEARMLPPIRSFPDIARAAFGETGCIILSVILYFELFSCVCIFFVTIGDHMHQLFPAVPASTHVLVIGGISMVPTIVLRTPALLSYLSMVGTFATIAVVASVVASALAEGDISAKIAAELHLNTTTATRNDDAPLHVLFNNSGLAMAFGLVAYCFSGHAIVPSIYTSMREPQRFEAMVTRTFTIVVCACVAVGVSGYYMFGSTVLDQVTLSLERSSKATGAMKVLTWLMVMTAFSKVTLTIFPLAIGMEELVAPYLTSEGMVHTSSALIKFVITALALFVAIYVPSFSFLCSLVGMICTMSVSVVLPAAAHYKLFETKLALWEKLLDCVFVAIGFFLAVAGTIATLR